MKASLLGAALLVFTVAGSAQVHSGQVHSGARPASTFGSIGGFGNINYPGVGHPPGVNPNQGFGSQYGGTIAGRPVPGGQFRNRNRYGYGYGYILPTYIDPSLYGYNFGYNSYPQQPPPEPSQVTVVQPAPQPAPTVTINQYFGPGQQPQTAMENADPGNDTVRVYGSSQPPPSSPAPDTSYYLIAFKDHSVYSAVGYWIDNGTLHYLTSNNTHNQASLDMVDADLTKKLNQDRGVAFNVPR